MDVVGASLALTIDFARLTCSRTDIENSLHTADVRYSVCSKIYFPIRSQCGSLTICSMWIMSNFRAF